MSIKIIGGVYKGFLIKTPKTEKTRPTTSFLREAVFNICQNKIMNAQFLDLFAGSGAMGIEALSRGAASVIFIEQDKNASKCIKENLDKLNLVNRSNLIQTDAITGVKYLAKKNDRFDLIYIDPPYGIDEKKMALLFSLLQKDHLLKEDGMIFFETSQEFKIENLLSYFSLRNQRKCGKSYLYEFVLAKEL